MQPSHPPESEAPTPTGNRGIFLILFLVLFLDLVGFSIVFPLFPEMLAYYLQEDAASGLLSGVIDTIDRLAGLTGAAGGVQRTVLFGGLLAGAYSLLQFVCTPILGALSDRYGRRPILLVSLAGLALSYAIWVVADTFALLVLSRVIGGVMSANISTATAVAADITSSRNRSRGMAIIGVAFGIGFIVGPAIGGLSVALDWTELSPGLARYGINPFSTPAAIALVLTVANLVLVAVRFPETRPPAAAEDAARPRRTANPLALFRTREAPGAGQTNIAYFLFALSFSGAEFALSFLAADRFGYGPQGIAMLMLFSGVVLAITQGGYVRRISPRIGPRRMGFHGLVLAMPGLALLGLAPNMAVLCLGLLLMSSGAAQVFPCMAALVSLYSPLEEQGRLLGIYRSLGALARAVGPLAACMLFWRFGPAAMYVACAAFLLAPLAMVARLPHAEGVAGDVAA